MKLDVSLLRDIDQSPVKQKLVASMTALCKDMGFLVVAEGIETSAERDCVVSLGCDLLQGFLFARPGRPFPRPDLGLLGRNATVSSEPNSPGASVLAPAQLRAPRCWSTPRFSTNSVPENRTWRERRLV